MLIDLETVEPKGRVDVLLYQGAKHLVKKLEENQGLNGIWDNIQPHVNTLVAENMKNVEVPSELKVILGILQANYKKE